MDLNRLRRRRQQEMLVGMLLVWFGSVQPLTATDYFLTIGGGYDRSGNQASLEANVVFFQQLLSEKHHGARRHDIFFADGHDPAADLQIVAEKTSAIAAPATELLSALHRRRGGPSVTYRDHRVAEVEGPLDPALIRVSLERVASTAQSGDRLIIYVTAHGSEGPKNQPHNTTIDCWNGRNITVREFREWLSKLPAELPVVMVMAQCYCGGFGQTIFEDSSEQKSLAPQLRAGFFAQQHDLPAAGCRPDIEHDEEFSSYFWGALASRSRNGVPIEGCDINGDGVVSFAEAYAYAVTAGETIDIPLRTTDVLLKTFSRMEVSDSSAEEAKGDAALLTMSGKLETLLAKGGPVSKHIATQLSKSLGFTPDDDVAAVSNAYQESRRSSRPQSRGRSRQSSGRRDLLGEVSEKWPELGDERRWSDSPLLQADNQASLLAEIKQLPSWKIYDERLKQMEAAKKESDERELRTVKLRKLINALESIVLENNLPVFATPQVVQRYQQLLSLEESSLSPSASAR